MINCLYIIYSQEGVEGVLMWGFWDLAHNRPESAIVNGENWQLNKAGEAYLRYAAYLIQYT